LLNESALIDNSNNFEKFKKSQTLNIQNEISKTAFNKNGIHNRAPSDLSPEKLLKNQKLINGNTKNFEEETIKEKLLNDKLLKKRISIFDSNREINNKILNLVTPRTNGDLKFGKDSNARIDKLCRSLDYIFDSPKVTINLPKIYDSLKGGINKTEWLDKINENGNYLFTFLDENDEFLFGLICNTLSNKKIGKLFKKLNPEEEHVDDLKSPNSKLKYFESTFEDIKFYDHTIIVESEFTLSFVSLKLKIENPNLSNFFYLIKTRNISTIVNAVNLYDMC
jgi:hypothetical protein